METSNNVIILCKIFKLLKEHNTKLVLYNFDSFLFDFSKKDGKETLIKIKEIVSKKHPIKIKTGKNYDMLEAL